jgi:hypothetical protein
VADFFIRIITIVWFAPCGSGEVLDEEKSPKRGGFGDRKGD